MSSYATTPELDQLSGPTLRHLFIGALDRFGNRPAVVCGGTTSTYRHVVAQANRLAHALHDRGVGPGVPVALMMSNRAEYLIADQAIIRCGAVKVPLNDMLSASEIDFILRASGAVVAIADAGMLAAALRASPPALSTFIAVGMHEPPPPGVARWEAVLAAAPDAPGPPDLVPAPDDLGLIIYTGGTTGRPKGVMHTQRGLALNLLAHVVEMGLLDDERLLLTSPLPHSAGFVAQAGMLKGAITFVEARFDPDVVLNRIAEDGVTFTFMVPTMIYRLLDRADRRRVDTSSLRTVLYGAAPITVERLEQGLRLFGPVFMQLYGQSEAPNFVTRLSREDHTTDRATAHRLTSCGQPVLMARVAVLDDEGNPLPIGSTGEIAVRAPYVMAGYHNLPEKSAEVLRGGWLHTGDIGQLDAEGYLYLLDRKSDVIITGGMNVYSTEVEQVVLAYPGVAQVAVVGMPHPDWGEAVVAFVVPESDRVLDDAALSAHCRAELSAYKRPKGVQQVTTLPTTAYGKIDKKALRQQAGQEIIGG